MLIIQQAHIYAPEDLGTCDVLIGGEKILQIAPSLPAEPSYDITCIDGRGFLLVPGFIDAHVHILGGGGEGGPRTRTPEIMLSDITAGGVTTVVGCLGTDGTTRTMASLLAKAGGLEAEGITSYIYTGSYQVPVKTLTGSITDDIMLLEKVVGTGEIAISDHRSSVPTKEEFARIVAETRLGGILSGKAGIVNIHMGDGKQQLSYLRYVLEETEIKPSNMLPTHMNRKFSLFEDGLDYAKNMGGYIDLTTSFDPLHMEEDELRASTGLSLALKAGVSPEHITFSSDGQGSLPIFGPDGSCCGLGVGKVTSLFEEMKAAVLIEKVSLPDALKTITSNPAALLKLPGKGRIEKGMDGDCVLLKEGSLEIDTVIAKGSLMVSQGRVLKKGTFEA